ncbi:nitrate reductase molybdenum cofactor assembly chaperone [Brevibacillus daliensis]|uniref:nitrate reductase molybdenum cofactor assembly chaperone n=1 Tax=Brevibacillus daliensis TaxID=2892995 RepID=UPI001E5CB04F|nr:nitrate reductase molybdenum cofactor assembly chaperone [Brevibacillus daliensis]
MDDQTRIVLAIASRILSYPTEAFKSEQADIEAVIREDISSKPLRKTLAQAVAPIYDKSKWRIMEHYVETFDLKEKAGLYLTAHELGDSRKRGIALIELRRMIREAGFECGDDELADYIPMLYELLAHSEESEPMEQLRQRLSFATQRIRRHLAEDNPYKPFFSILMEAVFKELSPQDMEKLEQGREKPDLDTMPYPLMYK